MYKKIASKIKYQKPEMSECRILVQNDLLGGSGSPGFGGGTDDVDDLLSNSGSTVWDDED